MYLNIDEYSNDHAIISVKNMTRHVYDNLNIFHNEAKTVMLAYSSYITFYGMVVITNNEASNLMTFEASNLQFNGLLLIGYNEASGMQMYSCKVT